MYKCDECKKKKKGCKKYCEVCGSCTCISGSEEVVEFSVARGYVFTCSEDCAKFYEDGISGYDNAFGI